MKINFRRYLYIVSIALIVSLSYIIDEIFFFMPYSKGGIKYFDNFNKTWPFIQYKLEKVIFELNYFINYILNKIGNTFVKFTCRYISNTPLFNNTCLCLQND